MKAFSIIFIISIIFNIARAQSALDYANAGDSALVEERFLDAIDNYEKCLDLDQERKDFLTAKMLGNAYEKVEDFKSAGDAYKDALLRGSDETALINNMKKAYEAANCQECLVEAYHEVKRAVPELVANIDRRLYSIYTNNKEWDKAADCVVSILSDENLSNDDRIKYLKYGAQIAINRDNAEEIESYYEKVLAITPDDADIHKAMGFGLYNSIQKIIQSTQNAYKAKGNAATNHDFSMMQTAAKRATLKYGPKVINHLKIANKTLNDAQITKIIAQLQQNITAYSK